MTVDAIMRTKGRSVVTVRPDQTVAETVNLLSTNRIGASLVVDGKGQVVGVISERDIVSGMARFGKSVLAMHVRNLMSETVITCKGDDTVKEVMTIMNLRRIRHLPVCDNGQLKGIVSIGDVVGHRLREKQMEADVLRDYAMAMR